MKQLFYISLIFLLASCTASRKSSSSHVEIKKDSSASLALKADTAETSHTRHTIVRDSAIGVPAKEVKDSLAKEDQEIPRTKSGKAKPIHRQKEVNGLTAYIDIDTNGNIQYGCKSDSMTIVIKNLIRERDSVVQRNKQFTFIDRVTNSSHQVEDKVSKATVKKGFWDTVMANLPLIALIALILWFVLSMLFRSQNPLSWFKGRQSR